MSYDPRWYRDYSVELQRREIRTLHDSIFQIYKILHRELFLRQLETIDLGCGTCEFGVYAGGLANYAGIDIIRLPLFEESRHLSIYQSDYKESLPDVGFTPNSFVSLFSTEFMMRFEERENYYYKLFKYNPAIKTGLVAGVYYRTSPNEEEHVEIDTEGRKFTIYQTIQKPVYHESFTEMRIETYPHYRMFPSGCVEVWRIFTRR